MLIFGILIFKGHEKANFDIKNRLFGSKSGSCRNIDISIKPIFLDLVAQRGQRASCGGTKDRICSSWRICAGSLDGRCGMVLTYFRFIQPGKSSNAGRSI